MCPGATGDGCIHADATRNIGGVIFGDLPSGITKPANWNGYFLRLQNFSDSVSAEAGVGSAAPTGTAPNTGTGQIGYWNGTGYTTCTIYAVSCPPATVPSFTWNRTIDGHVLAITMSATLQAGGAPSPTQTPSSCSGTCTRTQATSVSGSPIVGNVTYLVVYNGNQIANLNIHVDLGTLRATASYQAAPSGA